MAWSKLDIIGAALAEIGLGGYVFDATAQEKQDFLSRLDAMMASWQDDGINSGYGVEDDPSEMAPSYGKQVMQQTLFAARKSYSRALRGGTPPIKSVNPTAVPAGAGHHYDSPQVFTLPGVDE